MLLLLSCSRPARIWVLLRLLLLWGVAEGKIKAFVTATTKAKRRTTPYLCILIGPVWCVKRAVG